MYEQYINIIEHSTIKQIELTETNLNKIINKKVSLFLR